VAIRELGYAVEREGGTLIREGKESSVRTRADAEAVRARGGGRVVHYILADPVADLDGELPPLSAGPTGVSLATADRAAGNVLVLG
jgi:hypothetical protein